MIGLNQIFVKRFERINDLRFTRKSFHA